MTNKNSFTQVSALTAVLAILDTFDGDFILVNENQYNKTDLTEKVSAMLSTIQNKRSTPSKADKAKSAEHTAIMEQITATLSANGDRMTISEMQTANPALAVTANGEKITNQKMSAILKKMVDSGTVVKTIEKKKTYFALAVSAE